MTADEQTGLDVQIELAATPEQVWDAISTTHGISSWFLPAEVEGRHITFHHLPGETSPAEITDLEPPHRLRFTEADGAQATEFLIEARAGGTCVMRVVGSGFGGEGAQEGWTAALMNLKLYLEHFRGQPSWQVLAGELVPGVKAVSAYGHTPGHTVYAIESKGQKLMVWGDLMHVAAVQFPDPSVTIQFDTDSKKAAPQRQKAYADAAKNGYYVAIAHVSFPGIGQLRADGKGYRWLPVNYSSNK